ncbi:hypothetical protein CHS0354_021088 [Potamilus streckersoni]|uniref:Chitin synthase 1 n=1 Tax=Potamilus streckersoni TaxID=2493646 RepID=A0AAE0SCY6_9BIVA|nr:hypothetical protein CHS0354_021088 [Potamilus streckersoni]
MAGVMTLVYALVMMVVVVGLILQLISEGICSPTAIFMIFLVSVFVISAILHPQEFYCILHGALYFLAVPSMSMLLMMYSICNLHIVSWGTRESATAVPVNNAKQAKKTSTSKIQSILNRLSNNHDEHDSDYGFSFGNLFKCLCCPRPRADSNEKKFEMVLQKLETIEKAVASGDEMEDEPANVPENKTMKDEETSVNCDIFLDKESSISNSDLPTEDNDNPVFKTTIDPNDEELSPYWIQDSDVGKGRIRFISNEEKTFWRDLIDKYLFPLENNEAQKKQMQQNLIELRNKMSLMFFMINGLFIVIIFTLQYTNGIYQGHGVSIPFPCKTRNKKLLTIEPLSFAFMAVFGLALVIQFISMFFHRLGTFLHIVASTEVNCMKPNQGEITAMDIASKVQLVREMQSFEDDDDTRSVSTVTSDFDEDSSLTQDDSPKMKKRKTVIRITKRKRKPVEERGTLGTKFMKSFMELANDLRNEQRPSESSDKSKKERDSDKKRSRKAMRALGSIQQEKDIVLSKADAIEVKWRKLAARARGEDTHNHSKVDSWLSLVKDVIHQSRTSLNVIGEEEKGSSLPRKRGGASRSNSIEFQTEDLHNLRHLPQRSSYAGVSSLNIISDEDEPTSERPIALSAITNIVEGPGATDDLHTYETVVMEPRPRRDRIVSDENNPEARSIESDSDLSDSPVTSMKENKHVELRETNTSSFVRFAQPTTVTNL